MSDDQIIRVCRHGSDATRCVFCEEQPGGLANADPEGAELAAKAGLLNFDGPQPDSRDFTTLASFSAEQTAEFLRGGDLGKPTIHDEHIAARMERQRLALRQALYSEVVPAIVRALEAESEKSAARLSGLATNARSGDPRASQLMAAMLGELLTQGLQP